MTPAERAVLKLLVDVRVRELYLQLDERGRLVDTESGIDRALKTALDWPPVHPSPCQRPSKGCRYGLDGAW